MAFLFEKLIALSGAEVKSRSEQSMGEGMRMALKGSTPSAHARLKYITRQGIYAKGIDGPRTDLVAGGSGNLPTWASNADQFWKGTDQFERANGRRCVELELNLPPELDLDQQRQVVEAYAQRLLGSELLPHTWAIHDGGGKNPHCHLMFQERGLDGVERPNGQAWFKRANHAYPERGGAMKSRSIHGAAWTMHARATWANAVNNGLRAAGHAPRFDHRSKAVQRTDALRNGDLRRAAELGTLTELHEGATVHGMRRRVDLGDIELAELPDYAQQIIQQNDRVRAYNNELRDWVRSATEAELVERLGLDLADLTEELAQESPGAHITAWQIHFQQLALELEKAHEAAIAEWVDRARSRVIELRPAAIRPPDPVIKRLKALKASAESAATESALAERARKDWREGHPRRAALADFLDKPLAVDLAAELAKQRCETAIEAYNGAPVREAAISWQRAYRELKLLEQQLPAMELAVGLKPMHELEQEQQALKSQACELLGKAIKDLDAAIGLINSGLLWCRYDERVDLFSLRDETTQEMGKLKELYQTPPNPVDAMQLCENSAGRREQAKLLWQRVTNTAKIAEEEPRESPDQTALEPKSTIRRSSPRPS